MKLAFMINLIFAGANAGWATHCIQVGHWLAGAQVGLAVCCFGMVIYLACQIDD